MEDKFLLVANWKANDPKIDLCSLQSTDEIEIAVAAPYPLITTISDGISRAAQDVSAFPVGAYTGEVPATLLANLGVKYCLVGHSERRRYLAETNSTVEAKIETAIKAGIVPIICAQTLEEVPPNVRNFSAEKYLIMYEPAKAISTDGQYHSENPQKVAEMISDWQKKLPNGVRLLYGGSVNPQDVTAYVELGQSLVSGLVVGHASLETELFKTIVTACLHSLNSHLA